MTQTGSQKRLPRKHSMSPGNHATRGPTIESMSHFGTVLLVALRIHPAKAESCTISSVYPCCLRFWTGKGPISASAVSAHSDA